MLRILLSFFIFVSGHFSHFIRPFGLNFAFASNQIGTTKTAAEIVNLDIRLDVNGALITHPQARLKMGEKGSITQMSVDGASSYIIEVTPTRKDKGIIQLDFAIKKWSDGKTVLLSSPHVKTLVGRISKIQSKAKDQSEIMLTVSTLR
jgi:hypothetical protein